ncbi:M15 family metallopeptidase [Lacimicrobium sp. SS2-24]|uniref:M15 family metallopeptidase n=1 Tax=Lacimicrobium sp. SS2-24 TaxID=2005569 RepID=UPI000B4AB6F5|nr:M15 family metallopeptidase [Lacimicrobium sp. SS2-24]
MLTFEQLSGQQDSHLIEAEAGHKLQKAVATAFSAMREAAASDGVGVDLLSCFRSFERQMRIWNEKWHGLRPILDDRHQPLDPQLLSDKEKLFAILRFSALPGTSRHHWGSDFDVFDAKAVHACDQPFQLISEEYQPHGPCFELSTWLSHHADAFGFYRPYTGAAGSVAPEPWHLSHRATAEPLIAQMTSERLGPLLEKTDLAGKDTVLLHLDEIIRRYVRF